MLAGMAAQDEVAKDVVVPVEAAWAECEAEVEAETQAEAEVEAETQAEAEVETETQAEAEVEAEVEAKLEPVSVASERVDATLT